MILELDLPWIANACGASRAQIEERVQSLWSGYGEIVRVGLDGADVASVVVKVVRPPRARGRDEGHARKCRSYAVETAWYGGLAKRCGATCRVPRLVGSRIGPGDDERILILEDLDAAGFGGRTHSPDAGELGACLAWLASFHARFVGVAPDGLWSSGTYWHLATRREELLAIDDPALREAAPRIDRMLAQCKFPTVVHGDAKPANFCFASDGAVAAVDFQYVGGGCGMKDVAYLLDQEEPALEARLLETYFERLRDELARRGDVDAVALEAEWRALYPIASADYLRFLAGWAKEHFRRDRRGHERIKAVLRRL